MRGTSRIGIVLAACGLAWFAGCGGDGKPSVDTTTAEATIKGTITFKGKPVTKGEVSFDPSNVERKNETARRVAIAADGSYTVKTLAGMNRVSFAIPEMARDPKLQDLSLEYDARPGDNTHDIALPPPAAGATPGPG